VLRNTADNFVVCKNAVLIVSDGKLSKQGKHSASVERQHYGVLGKQAKC
jgi:SRSO17 transposase